MTWTDAGLLLLAVACWTFPYHRLPRTWRAVFTTTWWRA